MDADKQVKQAEEDEHADYAKIKMMMRNVENMFVFKYEQD